LKKEHLFAAQQFGQGDQMSLWKKFPKCSQTHFCQNYYINFTAE
jgi:hypothetical protein